MNDYEKLVQLVNDERVSAGLATNKDIGTKFTLGMTRHVWRYGCLSEGHERITDSQRYYAANREIYSVSNNIEECRFRAMEAKADLMDAEAALCNALVGSSDALRWSAAVGKHKAKLRKALDEVQDCLRGLDELCRIKAELEVSVMTQYPEGIEQAEPDNWRAVAEYRLIKSQVPGMAPGALDSVPMSPVDKAELGVRHGRLDAVAGLMVANKGILAALPEAGPESLPNFVQKMKEIG